MTGLGRLYALRPGSSTDNVNFIHCQHLIHDLYFIASDVMSQYLSMATNTADLNKVRVAV